MVSALYQNHVSMHVSMFLCRECLLGNNYHIYPVFNFDLPKHWGISNIIRQSDVN